MRARDEPVRLTRIYTRGGDAGETSLGDGSRVEKLDCRIGAFGAVDELNAAIGVVLAGDLAAELRTPLERVQNELFDVGADLAVPWGVSDRLRVSQESIDELERLCDHFNADLPELRSFVLPGGTEAAARLHVARTLCRRAERDAILASKELGINPLVLAYLNRLSDLLFILARSANAAAGRDEPLWRPGTDRCWPPCWTPRSSSPAPSWPDMWARRSGSCSGRCGCRSSSSPPGARSARPARTSRSPRRRPGPGGLRHAREGRVDWQVVAWMAPPSVLGAVLGALLADDVPEGLLYGVIAAVLVWSGIDLALRPIEPRPRDRLRLGSAAAARSRDRSDRRARSASFSERFACPRSCARSGST